MSELKYTAGQLVTFNHGGEELEGVIDFGHTDHGTESIYDIEAHDGNVKLHVRESEILGVVAVTA